METADFPEFSELLDAIGALLPPAQPLSGQAKAIFFRAVQGLTAEQFRAALDAHVRDPQRGRFFPRPADILAAAQGAAAHDGRPSADEAWAIAIQAADEGATVVWTAEICEAWGAALPALEARNTNPARMAFRDSYERLVAEARQRGQRVQWKASEGHDPERRHAAAEAAVCAGRLTHEQAAPLLAAPLRTEPVLLLSGPAATTAAPAHVLDRLQSLRAALTTPRDTTSRTDAERQQTEQAKAQAQALVQQRMGAMA